MILRKAVPADLPQLIEVYAGIYKIMQAQGINLWNERYPSRALPGDISAGILWLLCDEDKIAGAFALDRDVPCTDVQWQEQNAPAAILMRIGVSAQYQGKGVGRLCMQMAADTARQQGMKYLRLFVVDCNTPAELFYQRCGCVKASGIHTQIVDGIDGILKEYGYEIKL